MEAGERDNNRGGKVNSLIETATTSPLPQIDPHLLKAIKSVVRYSNSEVQLAFDSLMQKMETQHSQIRYLALLITDELFMRSKLFRSLLVVSFDQFLSLSIGFRRDYPLPAPLDVATRLRSKAIEFLEKWNISFGIHYRQVRLGFDYLKNTLRFQFPNLQQNAARREYERRERERKSAEILLNKFEKLRENLSAIKEEIQITVEEINECLDILRPKEDDSIPFDHEEYLGDFRSAALQQIRLESLKEGKKLHESNENKIVFDTLRELYKIVVTKHLVSIQEWISLLTKVEPPDTRFRDSTLRDFIDLRNSLRSLKCSCEESGCTLTTTTKEEDEDIWEEVKVEAPSNETTSVESLPSSDPFAPFALLEKNKTRGKAVKSNGSKKVDSLKGELLAEAPVMTWGSYLDNWGVKRDFMANQRGLDLESHWGRVDYDAVIPAEKIAELNVQATLYKEEEVDINPCLAPLKNGSLCQRRDMRVCPFHGPIIPRDTKGNPIDQNLSTNDGKSPKLETEVLETLARQAVKNVRKKDRDEAKVKYDERQMKRAKKAMVKEHNVAVLREAAMASTSYSENVVATTATNNKDPIKENKKALANMLKKKVTPKDRLGERLLSRRANKAAVQCLAEDIKYREAYPNQW
ncbi:hypothetical protein ACHQM5_027347 [Ranunculus cassubicifolius]